MEIEKRVEPMFLPTRMVDVGATGAGDSAGVCGLTDFGEPVHALRVRYVDGRKFPTVAFERYVDDAVGHCASEKEALMLRDAIRQRLAEVGLTLHPDKTKIVYCQNWSRRTRSYENTSFTFLGYEFWARTAQDKNGQLFGSVLPAISKRGREADQPRSARLAAASAYRLDSGPDRAMDQSDRAGLVAVLRPVLSVKAVCAVQTRQHLPGAVGSEEISAVAGVQKGQCLVESVGAGLSPMVRSLAIHPWLHGNWMVGAV
jgi:hypothetical protein